MADAKRKSVERWLSKAERDLITARTILDNEPALTDVVCYHAQQCAEQSPSR